MTNVEAMTVVDPVDDLLEVAKSLGRRKSSSRDEVVEQLSSLDVLQDQEPECRSDRRRTYRVVSGENSRERDLDERERGTK